MAETEFANTPRLPAETGQLQVRLMEERTRRPIKGAQIHITYEGEPEGEERDAVTDESGMTEMITLPAPNRNYSTSISEQQPYAEYTIRANADGYEPTEVAGTEILPDETAIQEILMKRSVQTGEFDRIVIGPHTLFGNYPPKIAESEIKPMTESGEIVLSRVVIPEYVIVHDGAPSDSSARNYWVRYRDYIKNVASSEIYATWTDAAIRANVLAIMSFVLNRVYTEWYRNRGYDFTITSSTAFDQKWIYGRNIYQNISNIVDEVFGNYLSRPNVKQPILTQYCDGRQVSCPGWMTQWGSKSLADDGLTAIQILRYYYGDNLYINTSETISGIPSSYPGYDLTIGSIGDKVSQLQRQLARIALNYPAIGSIAVDGVYGQHTADAVKNFQQIFNLPATGVTDYKTWYKISQIYVGVTKIAENV